MSGNGESSRSVIGAGAPGAVGSDAATDADDGPSLTPGALAGASAGTGGAAEAASNWDDGSAGVVKARMTGTECRSTKDQPSRWGVLRHVHFRNVWMAALVSNTGNWMELLGVQMLVAHETQSLKMLGILAAAHLSPILALGLVGGVLADRVNRRTLLVVTQIMLMGIAVALAAVSYFGAPPIAWMFGIESDIVAALLVLSAVQGIVMAFNMPAWQVLTPRLVPRAELTKAITLNGVQFNLARVIGPALGGWIMAATWGGATPLFVINAVTFLAVVIAVISTPDAPAPPHHGEHPWRQLAKAMGFIAKNKGPLLVFLAMFLMSLLAAPLVRLLPMYAIDVYGLDMANADRAVGRLLAVLGIGAVIGGLLLKFIPPWYPKHHFIPMSLSGAGLTIGLFALTGSLAWGYITMFFCGLFWIWGFNQTWAAMQHLVEDSMRGRVMATANVASFGATAIGTAAAGWLGESVSGWSGDKSLGTHVAVGGLAVVLLCAGIIMLLWRVPQVDGPEVPYKPGTNKRSLLEGLTARSHWPTWAGAGEEHAAAEVEGSEKSEPRPDEVA
ncbi:MAG: MFS transporter [Phycisphaeraceae bacterium]|nr:MFS transporter [Phycisphaeraceae bacterium]MBX3407783.1 MFS transporter [Phycisphaeraceae bacterium]